MSGAALSRPTAFSTPLGRRAASQPLEVLPLLPAIVVLVAVLFNPFMAIVNGHVTALTPSAVIGAEVLIVSVAHLLAISQIKRAMLPWYGLILLFVLVALVRSLEAGEIDVRYLRDVLLIPTFVVLGMTFDDRRLTPLVVGLHAVVLAVLMLEALNTSAFSALFKVQDYYINTRGLEQEDFWNRDLDLYVSAARPDDRFFAFVDLHRLSSIFLEPVSLGNYCIVMLAFICAFYKRLSWRVRAFLIGGTLLALVGCDGRLAAMSAVVIIAIARVAPWLPPRTPFIYLPGVTLMAFFLVESLGFEAGPDNFAGRIAHGVQLIERYGVSELLGTSSQYLSYAVDSGLAYLITTQSVFGVGVLWLVIVFASAEDTREQVRYTHAVCIYLAFTMMVSFGFLTIKTASILWFIHGSLQAGRVRSVSTSVLHRFGRDLA